MLIKDLALLKYFNKKNNVSKLYFIFLIIAYTTFSICQAFNNSPQIHDSPRLLTFINNSNYQLIVTTFLNLFFWGSITLFNIFENKSLLHMPISTSKIITFCGIDLIIVNFFNMLTNLFIYIFLGIKLNLALSYYINITFSEFSLFIICCLFVHIYRYLICTVLSYKISNLIFVLSFILYFFIIKWFSANIDLFNTTASNIIIYNIVNFIIPVNPFIFRLLLTNSIIYYILIIVFIIILLFLNNELAKIFCSKTLDYFDNCINKRIVNNNYKYNYYSSVRNYFVLFKKLFSQPKYFETYYSLRAIIILLLPVLFFILGFADTKLITDCAYSLEKNFNINIINPNFIIALFLIFTSCLDFLNPNIIINLLNSCNNYLQNIKLTLFNYKSFFVSNILFKLRTSLFIYAMSTFIFLIFLKNYLFNIRILLLGTMTILYITLLDTIIDFFIPNITPSFKNAPSKVVKYIKYFIIVLSKVIYFVFIIFLNTFLRSQLIISILLLIFLFILLYILPYKILTKSLLNSQM